MPNPALPSNKKMLLAVLTVDSLKALVRHRSFVLLIFIILLLDKILHSVVNPERLKAGLHSARLAVQSPQFLFTELPKQLHEWLFSPTALAVLGGLFLFKQLISLWPSSSLRRWHNDQTNAGLLQSLTGLKLRQFCWDCCALGLIILLSLGWAGFWFGICRFWWQQSGTVLAGWAWLLALAAAWPLIMAGLSYSSKLAVLGNGSFRQKFGLFLELLRSPRVLLGSWLFFLARIILETLFVAVIPLGALLYLDQAALRILLSCVSITPTYAYLKMASFKFFLFIYSPYQLIQQEFGQPCSGLSSAAPTDPGQLLAARTNSAAGAAGTQQPES